MTDRFTSDDFKHVADLLRKADNVGAVASNNLNVILAALDGTRRVTVCDSCLQASCVQGIFYCDDYKTAGMVDLPIDVLERLRRENPSYWEAESP